MRVLLLLFAASACTGTDHEIQITGEYLTNYDSVLVHQDGGEVGSSVIEVIVSDDLGELDDAFFHSDSVNGRFAVSAPDGAENVRVELVQHTDDFHDIAAAYVISGALDRDVDLGTIDLSQPSR
jgi:hypothetical protein